jgi:hypothetical protein
MKYSKRTTMVCDNVVATIVVYHIWHRASVSFDITHYRLDGEWYIVRQQTIAKFCQIAMQLIKDSGYSFEVMHPAESLSDEMTYLFECIKQRED